jgi:hypothetical protein
VLTCVCLSFDGVLTYVCPSFDGQVYEDLGRRGGLGSWRRVRGDGNSYYRAFMLAYLHHCLSKTHSHKHVRDRVLAYLHTHSKHAMDRGCTAEHGPMNGVVV